MLSPRSFQHICALGGLGVTFLYIFGCPLAEFIPPMPPSWNAQQISQHYVDHRYGFEIAAICCVFSGMSYLCHTAVISAQMRRVSNTEDVFWMLHLVAGGLGSFVITMFGLALAITNYRLDRPAEITQAFNDGAFILLLLTGPIFLVQNWAFAFGLWTDTQHQPLFPYSVAFANFALPLFYLPATAVHCFTEGPLAWDGIMSYWLSVLPRIILLLINSRSLVRAIHTETGGPQTSNYVSSAASSVK